MDDLVPQYVRDLAANLQKNSLALADAILRYDSVEGLDLISLMATRGTMGYRQTLESARSLLAGDMSVHAARELFDPPALSALARLLACRPGDEADFSEAADLFRAVRQVRRQEKLSLDADRLDAQTNLMTGHFDYVDDILPTLEVDDDLKWMIRTELVSPLYGRTGSQEAPWLESFNSLFLDHGLLPLSITEGTGVLFDRVEATVPDAMIKDTQDLPLVSIIMSTFKPDQNLRTAVSSLLNQTWRNIEILVVDDCSPPEFGELLHEAAALDDRVRLIRMERNGGTYKIRNYAMSVAKGEFIGFQDSDDWSHPERIERQMAPLLGSDRCVATMSRSIRVTSNLRLGPVGFSALRQNASSLLFHRARVLEKLGGFDPVRKGADAEFIERLKVVFGPEQIDLLWQPLAVVQLTDGSLSRAEFRYGWIHGSRVHYREAFEYWHRQIALGAESAFLDPGAARRFVAPARFLMTGQIPDQTCDVLLISDWRAGIGRYVGAPGEVRALSEAGLSTAVAQSESIRYALRRRQAPTDEMMALRSSGKAIIAQWDANLRAHLLLIKDPELLNFPRAADTVKLSADRLVLVAGYPCRTPAGWLTYDPALVENHAREMFGVEPEWLPAHEGITASLREDGAKSVILPARRLAVVEVNRRPFSGLRGGSRPIVGAAGIESPPKDRVTLENLRHMLPDDDRYDVRIKASKDLIVQVLAGNPMPPNWLVMENVDLVGFFGQLDFFVGTPMRSWGPELSRAALEAIANGAVAILEPSYEAQFGDAALYAGADEVKGVIDALVKDPAAFNRQQSQGFDFVESQFSAQVFKDVVSSLVDVSDDDRKRAQS